VSAPISIDDARARVLEAVRPMPREEIASADSLGRVLAEPVTSTVDVPPFDASAMDGYAVGAGTKGELTLAGESRAGHPAGGSLAPGTAVRISTGAVVPDGAVAVVAQERAEEDGGVVSVPAVEAGANIRRRGEDVKGGETVLAIGAELGPAALGMLAAVGAARVACARRPRMALLATGDELTRPGEPLGAGRIWSSNAVALAAQAERAGALVAHVATVPDALDATCAALAEAAASADVVCVSGGVSVGPHDHVQPAFTEAGFEERFWGVALRPGKPTWFGTGSRGGAPVLGFGLPGNPVSAMVTFQLFARPALRALQGADPHAPRTTAALEEAIERNPSRTQAVRCHVEWGSDGPRVRPTGPQGSHVLTSMLDAGALAFVPPGEGALAAGARVEIELLDL